MLELVAWFCPLADEPLLFAALGVQHALKVFDLARRHARRVVQFGGMLLTIVGLMQVTGVWALIVVANWQTLAMSLGLRAGVRTARRPVCRRVAALLLAAAATLVASGCQSGASEPATTAATSSGADVRSVGPTEFAREIAGGRRYLVNVHTPDEGSIEGTDVAIPFDQIEDRAGEFPDRRTAPLAVYCLTGNMSEDAGARLSALGYTDIVELRGGMTAWRAEDRTLLPPAAG